jgi:hypothetical protein
MDNADYCRRQAQECRRLLRLLQSAAQARALKNLCHSWVRLANQADLYAQVVKRERGSEKIEAVPIRGFAFRQRAAVSITATNPDWGSTHPLGDDFQDTL